MHTIRNSIAAMVIAVLPGQVSAQEEPEVLTAEMALANDASQYAERYTVSLEEAARRIAIMADQKVLLEELGVAEKDISGVWFDNGETFTLQVRTTGPYQGPSNAIVSGRGNSQEANGLGRLISQAKRIDIQGRQRPGPNRIAVQQFIEREGDRLLREIPSLKAIGHDERNNQIVLQVSDRSVMADDVKLRGPIGYRILHVENAVIDLAARGGTTFYYQSDPREPACTTAFMAKDPEGNPGFVTAGHCKWGGNFIYQDGGREYQLYSDNRLNADHGYADMRFFRIPSALTWYAQFYGNRNEAARALTGRRTITSTNARYTDNVAQGSQVCFYGRVTGPTNGQACGEVVFKRVYFPSSGPGRDNEAGSYFMQVLGKFGCLPGDSGAPVFAWNTAFGVVKGCDTTGSSASVDRYMTYTSTDYIYDRDFSLAY